MPKIQKDLYIKHFNDKYSLFKKHTDISILGIEDFDKEFVLINNKYKIYKSKNNILHYDNVENFSTKLYEMLKNIATLTNKEGTILIYSNYLTLYFNKDLHVIYFILFF